MKFAIIVASLVAMGLSQPVAAQIGPAGVPGLFELVESITAPTPTPPAPPKTEKPIADECSKAKDAAKCRANFASSKTVTSCKGKRGKNLELCLQKLAQTDCSKSPEPLVCERHQRAHSLCKDKIGPEHRQCLRDNLAPRK